MRYVVLVIKPMSVGRGQAPQILEEILRDCPVTLGLFRQWSICSTTLQALSDGGDLNFEAENIHALSHKLSWVCLFTGRDESVDPFEVLSKYCGPLDPKQWLPAHLRHRYGGYSTIGITAHASDTVVHLSSLDRSELEADLLFTNFNREAFR